MLHIKLSCPECDTCDAYPISELLLLKDKAKRVGTILRFTCAIEEVFIFRTAGSLVKGTDKDLEKIVSELGVPYLYYDSDEFISENSYGQTIVHQRGALVVDELISFHEELDKIPTANSTRGANGLYGLVLTTDT